VGLLIILMKQINNNVAYQYTTGWLKKTITIVQIFSFASSKLRASKHGSFSSIDSWSSSGWMFAKDGYYERWYWTSDCTYNTVVGMNHPETHSVTTLTQRVQLEVDTSIKCLPNLLLFNNNCSTRTLTLFVTTSGFLIGSSLVRANYSHIYILTL